MPRKPQIRPRRDGTPSALPRSHQASRAGGVHTQREFHQCLACGAPADPMYGLGENSWCPSCHRVGEIYSRIGQLPDAQLYGRWFLNQKEQAGTINPDVAETALPSSFLQRPSFTGEVDMKQRKTHTGTYSCPQCCVEYELSGETVLKCEDCGGPLYRGTLEEFENSEGDPEQ